MKKKIVLKRLVHHDEKRLAVLFDYDNVLIKQVKSINGIRWSNSKGCFHAPDDEKHLKQILAVFREIADIDISAIVSTGNFQPEVPSVVEKVVKEKDKEESFSYREEKNSLDKSAASFSKKVKSKFDPVIFSISGQDEKLVVKFTGRYDQEWIEELNGFGKLQYDKNRKEWLLRWSQLAVDSLNDYFSSKGIEVIVKKQVVSSELKEVRSERGSEVRERKIGKAAVEAIEDLRIYLEEKRYSKRTIESYKAHLELFFKYFNEKEPSDITEEDVTEFIDNHILRLGYSASYQNLVISAIKMYYNLQGDKVVNSDTFERPRRSRALPKVFSKEEVMKIFNATRNNKHRLILWLIYSCGLRRSELTNIKLTDLDRDRGILHIREGKGNVDRMVPIAHKVWEKIDSYLKVYSPKVYLFEGQSGGRYSAESVYSVFKQSVKRAGLHKEVGVHCLRHSYATHLHESGLDIRYIQELLGHKSTRTTEIYTHVSRRNLFAIRSPIEDMDIE